jgi:hypothetical protein
VCGTSIFAGGDFGVYKSTNNGINWTLTSLTLSTVSFAVNGNNIFAGTWISGTAKGVYLSTDNGTSWTQTSLNNRNINSMAVSGNNVFAGGYQNGFYVSTNNGSNWTPRNEGITGTTSVFALCILNNYIFAGTGTYGYRRPLSELIIGIQPISMVIPEQYKLHQNYPNPFNPVTKISFDIAKTGFVSIVVYDALGRKVETLVSQQMNAGSYNMDFNGAELTSGVYFYKMEANGFANVKRMVVLK